MTLGRVRFSNAKGVGVMRCTDSKSVRGGQKRREKNTNPESAERTSSATLADGLVLSYGGNG